MNHLFPFCNLYHEKWKTSFPFSLLNIETNVFNKIMHSFLIQTILENRVKRIKQLNKNCCNGVSCTQLLRTQTMRSKWQNLVFLFLVPFVIYLSLFDLLNLSNFFKIPLMNSLDILSFGTPWKIYIKYIICLS